MGRRRLVTLFGWAALALSAPAPAQTWIADNDDGTFTNPLFFDEFSDPDLIRVGGDFYMTGTTMHSMPGLRVRRSQDLVNWTFVRAEPEGRCRPTTPGLGPTARMVSVSGGVSAEEAEHETDRVGAVSRGERRFRSRCG